MAGQIGANPFAALGFGHGVIEEAGRYGQLLSRAQGAIHAGSGAAGEDPLVDAVDAYGADLVGRIQRLGDQSLAAGEALRASASIVATTDGSNAADFSSAAGLLGGLTGGWGS
jgi:hypothetical protein